MNQIRPRLAHLIVGGGELFLVVLVAVESFDVVPVLICGFRSMVMGRGNACLLVESSRIH